MKKSLDVAVVAAILANIYGLLVNRGVAVKAASTEQANWVRT